MGGAATNVPVSNALIKVIRFPGLRPAVAFASLAPKLVVLSFKRVIEFSGLNLFII